MEGRLKEKKRLTIEADDSGRRIDLVLAEKLEGCSRSFAARLIEDGLVLAGGKIVAKNYKAKAGEEIEVFIPEPRALELKAEEIPLDIVYEDEDLLVVNKPKGMVVHPAAGNYDGTLVNALLNHCGDSLSGINGVSRPGIVHRIDKDTSGLLLVAKNDAAHGGLAAQLKSHSIKRVYEAVVHGVIKEESGTVDAPIGRHPVDRKKMCVIRDLIRHRARHAVTHWEVVKRYKGFTHIRLRLETGRTHQIRVHMAYIGHPVAGDEVYGPKKGVAGLSGQCLHAKVIGFVHPVKGEYMEFDSPLPEYFVNFLEKLDDGGN